MLRVKIEITPKVKKTAWELLKEIPDTPEQRRIDREIAKIEYNYKKMKHRKSSKQQIKQKREKVSYSSDKRDFNYRKNRRIDNKLVENTGIYAGKIWNTINKYGPLNLSSVIKKTKLTLNDFYVGMGWLARENKICRDKSYYKLGETNLTFEIGDNAGKIWRLLDSLEKADLTSIKRLTNMNLKDIYSALGWLCCENKIKTIFRNRKIIFELN